MVGNIYHSAFNGGIVADCAGFVRGGSGDTGEVRPCLDGHRDSCEYGGWVFRLDETGRTDGVVLDAELFSANN